MTEITRTIFLTPGLVELGADSRQIHYQIAQKLIDKQIDLVILIDTSSSHFIAEYFKMAEKITTQFVEKESILEVEARNSLSVPKEILEKAEIDQSKVESAQKIPEVLVFKTASLAHSSLPSILRPGDAILFQNDWTDNYV